MSLRIHPAPIKPMQVPLTQPAHQTISRPRFLGEVQAGKTYGLNPDLVQIEAAPGVPLRDLVALKEDFMGRLLENHRQAISNQLLAKAAPQTANPTGYYFVAEAVLDNGKSYKGVNVEGSRWKTICAEQTAMINAETQERLIPPHTTNIKPAKAKWLLLANQTLGAPVTPCGECLDWMQTQRLYTPNTTIVSFRKNGSGRLVLHAQTLKDMLPYLYEQSPSRTTARIDGIPVNATPNAFQVMARKGITCAGLQEMMTQARQTFDSIKPAIGSQQNEAAGVLVNGQIYTAARHEWSSPRINEHPDVLAAAQGLQDTLKRQAWIQWAWGQRLPYAQMLMLSQNYTPPKVDAVAYYGDDPTYPKPSSLGRLTYPAWGGKETLIVSLKNDALQVKTAEDYFHTDYFKK